MTEADQRKEGSRWNSQIESLWSPARTGESGHGGHAGAVAGSVIHALQHGTATYIAVELERDAKEMGKQLAAFSMRVPP